MTQPMPNAIAPFDTARHLDSREMIATYLAEVFETGDHELVLHAIGNVLRAAARPPDWASDLAIDLIADAHRLPFVQAQEQIAQRLRALRRGVAPIGDEDHD